MWREQRTLFIAYEIVFAVALIGWAIFRAHSPDLSTTEKPMEFAFFNAINRSATFPPLDPWLSGYAIAYYYFGYVMMSVLHKLTGVTAGITFSLSNAFWFALAAASAFGVVANLVLLFKEKARIAAIVFATLGAVMLALMGNFQGPLEVAHANNIGSPEFWRWLDILEINGPAVQNPPDVPWWTPRRRLVVVAIVARDSRLSAGSGQSAVVADHGLAGCRSDRSIRKSSTNFRSSVTCWATCIRTCWRCPSRW